MNQPQKRKLIRLTEYDYSRAGVYFITICVEGKRCLFGSISEGKMELNKAGEMIEFWWKKLPEKFLGIELDQFIVMPDHFHGIIFIPDLENGRTRGSAPTISEMVQWFKTMTTNEYIRNVRINFWPKFDKKLWQRSYYDHIIRNEKSLEEIRKYINENPLDWTM